MYIQYVCVLRGVLRCARFIPLKGLLTLLMISDIVEFWDDDGRNERRSDPKYVFNLIMMHVF